MDKITELMIKEAQNSLKYSYSPYSKYAVSACIQCEDDLLFTGVNVENCSYGLTICAEVSAICKMVTAGQRQIKSMVLMAGNNELCPPCGACRQCIKEFSTTQTLIHLCNQQGILKSSTMTELLPMAFSLEQR